MQLTKKQFAEYEYVRESGRHNMFDVETVCKITRLDRESVFFIMRNYMQLKKYFELKSQLEVEDNADYLDKNRVRELNLQIKQIEVLIK